MELPSNKPITIRKNQKLEKRLVDPASLAIAIS